MDKVTGRAADWVRFTVREDFASQSWDLWVDGHLTVDGAGFQELVIPATRSYVIMGDAVERLALDDLTLSGQNPLGTDADGDGMLDADENKIGSNPAIADREGADAEGKSFREKWWRLSDGPEPQVSGRAPLPPVFSRPSALVKAAFPLTLSIPGAGKIYYTLDGSTPTPATGRVFTAPVEIKGTTVIRACAADEKGRLSGVTAAAWVFPDDVAGQQRPEDWPEILSGPDSTSGRRFFPFDPKLRTRAEGDKNSSLPLAREVADALEKAPVVVMALPVASLFGDQGVYENSTIKTLPKASGELVWMDAASPQAGGALEATVSVSGQSSRSHAVTLKHSLRVSWPSTVEAGTVLGEKHFPCDQFLLRQPTQDSWAVTGDYAGRRAEARYITDAWTSQWLGEQGHPALRHRWVHLFLNGTYWGVYEAVEQHDDGYSTRHPGSQSNLVEPDPAGSSGSVRAIRGSAAGWTTALRQLLALSSRGESASDEEWEKGAAGIDQAGLIDYILWNWWAANFDWPRNNWLISQEAGQWRFLSWDTEMAMPEDPELAEGLSRRVTADERGPAAAFTALSRWKKFRETVSLRFEQLTAAAGGLSRDSLLKSLARQEQAFGPLAAAESARWGGVYADPPFTPENWKNRMTWLREKFIPDRAEAVRTELKTWLNARASEARRVREQLEKAEPEIATDAVNPLDRDGDGIPDAWELRFGLDPSNPDDAFEDPDQDGVNSVDEFRRHTDPRQWTKWAQLDENSPGLHTKFRGMLPRLNPQLPVKAGKLDTDPVGAGTTPPEVKVPSTNLQKP